MRFAAFALLAILLSCAFAQGGLWVNNKFLEDAVQTSQIGASASPYSGEVWVQKYRLIALLAALVLIVLAAFAYFVGGALESESLKSWGRTELAQALATAVLVGCFLALLGIMDTVMEEAAKNIVPPCGPEGTWDYQNARALPNGQPVLPQGSPRAMQYAVCYIDNIYSMASAQAVSDLKNSLEFTRQAYTSQGLQGTNWWSLYFGFYTRPNAEMRLQGEMAGLQFDMVKNMMISLQAQKFLVGTIAAVLGPLLLLLGILLRAFPFTRRAGGMMLALSVGLLVILPSAYLLAWSTLVVAVYGNSVLGGPSEDLPSGMPDACESCRRAVPVAYNLSEPSKIYTASQYPSLLIVDAKGDPVDYSDGKAIAASANGKNIQTCYPKEDYAGSKIGASVSEGCPEMCRELPFPAYKQICDEKVCGQLPAECKVIRWINQTHLDGSKAPYCEKWNDELAFGCDSACSAECKAILPQIAAPDAITPPAVTENSCAECAACPLRCRVYSTVDGKWIGGDSACESSECQACRKSGNGKVCSLGLSPLASGEGCNHANLCGPARALADVPDGQNDVCPLECRIYFDAGKEDYKDKTYREMCDIDNGVEGRFYKACQRCPNVCKVNATLAGAVAGQNPEQYLLTPPLGSCSAAPTFDSAGKIQSGACSYCPVACRLKNPSPIDVAADPFISHANFPITCRYVKSSLTPSSGSLGVGSAGKSACEQLQNAQGYSTAETYGAYYRYNSLDGKDRCGPTSSVYKLANQPQHGLCPLYYFSANMVDDPTDPAYRLAEIPAQQRAAPECFGDEVKLACDDAQCPDTCKSDWPTFCTLVNPQDKYSRILENEAGACASCKTLNPVQNTTGPQCQAYLQFGANLPQKLALCNQDCYDSNCRQSCFPTLALPNNASCVEYVKNSNTDKPAAQWKDCAACPYDCRYDYAGSPPAGWEDKCGAKLLSDLRVRDNPYNPNQKYWICENTGSEYCETNANGRIVPQTTGTYFNQPPYNPLTICSSNKYSCAQVSSGKFWYCNFGSTTHACTGYFPSDAQHLQDWWTDPNKCAPSGTGIDNCQLSDDPNLFFGMLSFSPQSAPLYSCTPSDKYEGLNQWLDSELGITVCGDLEDKSGDMNFCGNVTYGGDTAFACDLDVEPNGCSVAYDARVKACLGVNWNAGSPPANTPDKTGCQWCPPSCRIATTPDPVYKYAYCPQSSFQSSAPSCDAASCASGCRVTAGPLNPPANLTLDNAACMTPSVGVGKYCPARCRTYYEGWTGTPAWKQYCTGDGIDCSDMVQKCMENIPLKACEACTKCETDCLARPYVRQNCDEVCETGAEVLEYDPAKMLGGWGDGVNAWPEHRTIGALGIAAAVLPLFALVIVLAFVRVLSPFLGGDIEIPGLMRFL